MRRRIPNPVTRLYLGWVTIFVLWCIAKVYWLHQWRYTSDLFSYDQILVETLGGHLGFEHTYGNHLGDHFFVWLIALAPLRALLGQASIYLLIFIPPLCFLAFGLFIRWLLGDRTTLHPHLCLLFGAAPLLLMPGAGLERVYGFHFDNSACYLGLALAAAWQYRAVLELRDRSAVLWLWWALFVTSQEVFALLAAVLFVCIGILERSRKAAIMAAASLGYFAVAGLAMRWAATQFNRGNAPLLHDFITLLREQPDLFRAITPPSYIAAVLLCIVVFAVVAVMSTGLNAPAVGLLAMGLAKLAMAFLNREFSVLAWHNFPGLVFCCGAIGMQAMQVPLLYNPLPGPWRRLALTLVTCGWVAFLYMTRSSMQQPIITGDLDVYEVELSALAAHVPPRRVASVDRFLMFPWRPHSRVTYYPHGVIDPPQGIADYVVTWVDAPPFPPVPSCYKELASSPHFTLYHRSSSCGALDTERSQFMQLFGPDTLGYDE